MTMKKRIFGILLSLALVLGMIPGMSPTALADTPVTYFEGNSENSCSSYVTVTSSTNSWDSGWYVVKEDVRISSTVVINGDVHLILCDSAKLTLEKGCGSNLDMTNSLTIYSQSKSSQMGRLIAKNSSTSCFAIGSLTVNGGDVQVTASGESSEGITAKSITVNDGSLTATGLYRGIDGELTINGGTVRATGNGEDGDGIICGNTTIKGGTLIAEGKRYGIYSINGISISSDGKCTFSGESRAINGTVKNSIPGTGWTDIAGTEGKAPVAIDQDPGQSFDYKKVQFPALPSAKVTKDPTINSLNYTGSAQELVTAGTASGGTMVYAPGDGPTTAPVDGWKEDLPVGEEAGYYVVWYKVQGDADHMDSDPKCLTVMIDPATVTAPTIPDKLYTGEKQTADVPASTLYNVTKNDGGTELGSYDVELTLTDDENYQWADGKGNPIILKFNIVQGTNTVTVSIKGWTYGEAANQPTVTATAGADTVVYTYAKTEDGDYTATVPSEAGTWYVKASIPATANYAAGEATAGFEIEKAKPEVTAPGVLTLKYSGEPQELVSAGSAKGGEMQYALGTETAAAGEYAAAIPTGTEAGTYYIWYKVVGDANHTDTEPACVTVQILPQSVIGATVTFKVVNGSWDDGTTADKTVPLKGTEGDTLALTADQIPTVGSKPNEGFAAGSWDVTPAAGTAITKDTTYTYTYAEKAEPVPDTVTVTVTFRVKNGFWEDGTTVDKTVKLTGIEGEDLFLKEEDIPVVGFIPYEGCETGSWDTEPSSETPVTRDTIYTYTYAVGDPSPAPPKTPDQYIIDPSSIGPTTPYTGPTWNEGLVYNKQDGKWYFWLNNRVQWNFSGIVLYDNHWFMIRNGMLDTDAHGLYNYDGGTFVFAAGQLRTDVNGLWLNPKDKLWYFLSNGQVQTQYTGLALYDGAWFYVVNGQFANWYTGVVFYDNAAFWVENGELATWYNGTITYDGVEFTVVGGQLVL